MFDEGDEEGPGLAVDREHFPLLRDRAALSAVGDGMLSALSSDRFSEQVGGRAPPVSFFLWVLVSALKKKKKKLCPSLLYVTGAVDPHYISRSFFFKSLQGILGTVCRSTRVFS